MQSLPRAPWRVYAACPFSGERVYLAEAASHDEAEQVRDVESLTGWPRVWVEYDPWSDEDRREELLDLHRRIQAAPTLTEACELAAQYAQRLREWPAASPIPH